MEEKIAFSVKDTEGQKLDEKVSADESLTEVSGGTDKPKFKWECCNQYWSYHENCGVCGKASPRG